MFGLRADEMGRGVTSGDKTFEGEIIGLCGSAGEDDFVCGAVQQFGDRVAGLFESSGGGKAVGMEAAGVSEFLCKKGEHALQHPGVGGSGGVMIEIDGGRWHGGFHSNCGPIQEL